MSQQERKDRYTYVSTTASDWSPAKHRGSWRTVDPVDGTRRSGRGAGRGVSERIRLSAGAIASRALWAVVGFALIAIGIVMLVLPGPGILSILAGIACLSRAFGPSRTATAGCTPGDGTGPFD